MSKLELEGFEEIVRELRGHAPAAPAALYTQLRELGEQPAARPAERVAKSFRWQRRRMAIVLVGVAVLAVAAGAVIRSQSGSGNQPAALEAVEPSNGAATLEQDRQRSTQAFSAATDSAGEGASQKAAPAPVIPSNRAAELRAEATLHVDTQEKLAEATARAMQIARARGGYVARAKYSAPARGEATSFLQLKIPAARAQRAWGELVALGEILSQDVSLVDLQRTIARQTISIRTLEAQIDELERSLVSDDLSGESRARLELQLANKRAQLAGLKASRQQVQNRGAMATVALTLTTADLADAPAKPSRIEQAFDDGWGMLTDQLAWAVKALLVALPLLVVAVVAVAGTRARRRRAENRLLER